ncbi:MAG: hypothetical protein ACKPKO_63450, partial [Candidatus Fonsibacter sp.]
MVEQISYSLSQSPFPFTGWRLGPNLSGSDGFGASSSEAGCATVFLFNFSALVAFPQYLNDVAPVDESSESDLILHSWPS